MADPAESNEWRHRFFPKRLRGQGVPPGWCILDEDWTVVVESHEKRAVSHLYPENLDMGVFACHQRFGTCLEFYLMGWVSTHTEAEQWLRGEDPDLFLENINPMSPSR